jgi:hypothetical protein
MESNTPYPKGSAFSTMAFIFAVNVETDAEQNAQPYAACLMVIASE